MRNERAYAKAVGEEHIRDFGQYFTDSRLADFICSWACQDAGSVLDPAVGNSVFLTSAKRHSPACRLTGYEIDPAVLDYFGNPASADIRNEDYLLNGWDQKYDAIVCNPPYNRFQAVANRADVLDAIRRRTGVRYSGYANLYILFLLKSIYQLSEGGRLAYIVPSEFMNAKYGTEVKALLVRERLLNTVINFENDSGIFFGATTTCCILLLDRRPKTGVRFYSLSSVDGLSEITPEGEDPAAAFVPYERLAAEAKWRSYISREPSLEYPNLKPLSRFCSVSRGIATGANDFFCFSLSKARAWGIPERCLTKCICRSADVRLPVFRKADFDALSDAEKTVYLLDITSADGEGLKAYLAQGKARGLDRKYLLSCRDPWYSMEQKPTAPIWVASACRQRIKFVRNVAGVKSLTTFHSVFVRPDYAKDVDLLFCYFLTPVAQAILRDNRKKLGNGLEKFQPNDLNEAKMLDIRLVTDRDREEVLAIYHRMAGGCSREQLERLNQIFSRYLAA